MSSGGSDGDLFALLEDKVLESFVEALMIGILLLRFHLFFFIFFAFVVFEIELPLKGVRMRCTADKDCAHTGSYITLMIKLQLGHVAMSSQSLSWALEISKRSPQGHG
jgi:hypothetical protein